MSVLRRKALLCVPSTFVTIWLTATAAFASEATKGEIALSAGTFPPCVFSDSGLGQNETIFGRLYCHDAVAAEFRYLSTGFFLRLHRSWLRASDAADDKKGSPTVLQTVPLTGVNVGKSLPIVLMTQTHAWLDLGLGAFRGHVSYEEVENYGSDDPQTITDETYVVTGLEVFAALRVPMIAWSTSRLDLAGSLTYFNTRSSESPTGRKYDKVGLPRLGVEWRHEI